MIDLTHLQYIKNVNDDNDWAYKDYPVGAYFQLNFKQGQGVEAHAADLPKGALILLSQKPPFKSDRYLTHIVELANEGLENKPQWESHIWGIFRWVKVCWVANFNTPEEIPLDKNVMQVDWGWQNTQAKSLTSQGLMSRWNDIETLKAQVKEQLHL